MGLTHVLKIGVIASAAWLLADSDGRAATYQCGSAAWFDLTGTTASGEQADASKLTAAHRTLPFNTRVKVENLSNGRAVIVRINDRGPFTKGRVIDVSKAAAQQLGFVRAGTTRVRISVVDGRKVRLDRSCSVRDRRAKPGRIVEAAVAAPAETSNPEPEEAPVPVPTPRLEVAAYAPVEAGGDLPDPDDLSPADDLTDVMAETEPVEAPSPDLADRFADTFAAAASNPKMTVASLEDGRPVTPPSPAAETLEPAEPAPSATPTVELAPAPLEQEPAPLPVEEQPAPAPVALEPEPAPAPAEVVADAAPVLPVRPGPQHGMAKREDWDRMQQMPN